MASVAERQPYVRWTTTYLCSRRHVGHEKCGIGYFSADGHEMSALPDKNCSTPTILRETSYRHIAEFCERLARQYRSVSPRTLPLSSIVHQLSAPPNIYALTQNTLKSACWCVLVCACLGVCVCVWVCVVCVVCGVVWHAVNLRVLIQNAYVCASKSPMSHPTRAF